MHEGSISIARLMASAWWVVVALLLSAAWVTWLVGFKQVWMLLGFTACASSAVAAVSHIRLYMSRVARLVRTVGGLDSAHVAHLRSSGD